MIIVAGLLIAIVAVLLVLEPVLRAAAGKPVELAVPLFADSDDEEDPLLRRRDRALAALREIEFDRATGKLSEDDFARLQVKYQAEALAVLREVDAAMAPERLGAAAPVAAASASVPGSPGASGGDAVEQLIAEARAQARTRKQRFCEECGTPLEGSGKFCVGCGTPVGAGA
jgi:hypothetical protein